MKTLSKVFLATAVAAIFSLSQNAQAQYKPTGSDGLTAAPRLRQMLDDREAATRLVPAAPSATAPGLNPETNLSASPRLLEMLNEQGVVVTTTPSAEEAHTGYRPTGDDGISAAPRQRVQIGERGPG